MTRALDDWFAYRRPNARASLRLFCFPYAGGSASIFRSWSSYLPAQVEVCPIQIPGRENRLMEPPYKRLSLLIEALGELIEPWLDKPFVLFGHSMGALIGFELSRWLRNCKMPQPKQLIMSGARAPQIPRLEPPIHQLSANEFIKALQRLNGTPEEVLRNQELMQIILPYILSDFELCETYVFQSEAPLSIPITVFGGSHDDRISKNELQAWASQTTETSVVHMFSGDHFFIHSSREQVLRKLAHELEKI